MSFCFVAFQTAFPESPIIVQTLNSLVSPIKYVLFLALNKELCLLMVSCVPSPKYTRSPKHLEDVAFHVTPLVLGPKDGRVEWGGIKIALKFTMIKF